MCSLWTVLFCDNRIFSYIFVSPTFHVFVFVCVRALVLFRILPTNRQILINIFFIYLSIHSFGPICPYEHIWKKKLNSYAYWKDYVHKILRCNSNRKKNSMWKESEQERNKKKTTKTIILVKQRQIYYSHKNLPLWI